MDHDDHERYYQIKTRKVRNVFKPRWWQFRLRYRIWSALRERERMLAEMDPVVRQAYEETCQEVERRTLFGNSGWIKPVSPPRDEDRPHGGPR